MRFQGSQRGRWRAGGGGGASPVGVALLGAVMLAGVACNGGGGGGAAPSLKPKLDRCEADNARLRSQVLDLKKKLAITLARPGTIRIDPAELAIDGKVPAAAAASPREGSIGQAAILKTIRIGKPALQACYIRALKRDTSLHHGVLKLNLSFQVRPNGTANKISIRPGRSAVLIDCMVKTIKRWRFPKFTGQPVGVVAPVTLTPKS